jgi:hypothetical protein
MYVVLVVPMVSYTRALLYPGQASVSVRTVEWIRDHGGGGLVDAAENWWYAHHNAPTTAPPPGGPAPLGVTAASETADAEKVPAALPALGIHPSAGEGVWRPGPVVVHGAPVMYETFVHPDRAHPGVLAAIARFDQHLVAARLIAGTTEPDRHSWPEGGQVPPDLFCTLVATFNSGFKIRDAHGGFYADSRVVRRLRDGAASLVIHRDGRISVDKWGRDAHLGPTIAAVRQNLALVIDNGVPAAGLDVNAGGRWGSSDSQLQYTWRSAIGVDADGNLFYVAGNKLTLATLTRALADANVVRGMELDIHPAMVHLFFYQHPTVNKSAHASIPLVATKLLLTMRGPVSRYLSPDQRDFVALTLRPAFNTRHLLSEAPTSKPRPDNPIR